MNTDTATPLLLADLKPALNPTLVDSGATLEKLRKFFQTIGDGSCVVGFDYETNITPDFYWRKARTLQFGNQNEQYIIDFLAFADGNEKKLVDAQGFEGKNAGLFAPVLDVIRPVMCSNKILKVGTYLTFEYAVSRWNFGMDIWHLYSIDLAERVIVAGIVPLLDPRNFSLARLTEVYFNKVIEKELQSSFDTKSPLTESQILYCALDTRLPLAIRGKQLPILERDGLTLTVQLENDSIGAFTDMHINGQRIDREKWMARNERDKQTLAGILKELDTYFIPFVGEKSQVLPMMQQVEELEKTYRSFGLVSPEEIQISGQIKKTKDALERATLRNQKAQLELDRKERKDAAKVTFFAMRKRANLMRDIAEKSDGEALINYGSRVQLRDVLIAMKVGITESNLKTTGDEALAKHVDRHPAIKAIRKMRGLAKQISTYGAAWVTPWTTEPSNAEGWQHPADGKIHSTINQLNAETGRTSSEKPNGQNLPKEDEVRACFIADPPDEEEPEGYKILTIDMSGAELRIIAEYAQAESWIQAFEKKWDVHSVSTEILYPAKWPLLACKGGEVIVDKGTGKETILPPCAYFAKDHQKCKCPEHGKLRDGTKSTNFLLCYGGGPDALAEAIGSTKEEAAELMALHESAFPDIWAYLRAAGQAAVENFEARTMFGRRRLFVRPTHEKAAAYYAEKFADRLLLNVEEQKMMLQSFWNRNKREPNKEERDKLLHRSPNNGELSKAYMMMRSSIERKGKNHGIQGTNVDVAKRSIGCGFSAEGLPYLWHSLRKIKGKMLNFVHDELLVQIPTRFAEQAAELVGDSFRYAAGEKMKRVVMESDFHIADRWLK